MKRDLICTIGAIVGLLTGLGRGIGGLTLLSGSSLNIILGIGLILISVWLVLSAIGLIIQQDHRRKKWLTAGIILFWIDGIVNGFILYGSPQIDGQIINLIIVAVVLICLWSRHKNSSDKGISHTK